MGTKVLLTVVSWLLLNQTYGDRTQSLLFQDNISAASAPRLYRNVQAGVYASAVPYGAYSFQLPTFAAAPKVIAPKPAASHVVPVKHNFMNHLTDSYGNRFVAPQMTAYQFAFPQQYVTLQSKLPEHLTQPLVAASANFQFKQSNGQLFATPVRASPIQGVVPIQFNQFPGFAQLQGDKVKNLAHSTVTRNQSFGNLNTQQQSTNNNAVFTTTQPNVQIIHLQNNENKEPQIIVGNPTAQHNQKLVPEPFNETKFQKIQESPHSAEAETHFQRVVDTPQIHHSHNNIQIIKETPSYHEETKIQHKPPQASHEQNTYLRTQALPQYESKFQIIHEKPHVQVQQAQSINEDYSSSAEIESEETPSSAQVQHSYESSSEEHYEKRPAVKQHYSHSNKGKKQSIPSKQTITYINDINGEKTIVELDTKPKTHLLDITLLEPLKFKKTFVPQVQHFLPRLPHATYKKLQEMNLPAVKKHKKEYANSHGNTYKTTSKKKHKKTAHENKYHKNHEAPPKPVVTYHESLEDSPEITYEISAPNYKETIKEKAVSYNKQTQSEPITYTYGSNSQKDPVTYSYTHMSHEPIQIKTVQYHGNGPAHLLYNNYDTQQQFPQKKSSGTYQEPQTIITNQPQQAPHEPHDSRQSNYNAPHTEQYHENHKTVEEHYEPANKEHYNTQQKVEEPKVVHENTQKYYSEPTHFTSENIDFQPIIKEYENNIRSLTAPSSAIKVDPHQHVLHQDKSTPQPQVQHREEHSHSQLQRPLSSPATPLHYHSTPEPQPHKPHSSSSYNTPIPHIHEKSKSIIIQEESPEERHTLREQTRQEVVDQEENSEENFEKAYQDSAVGFPAYNQKSTDPEKDIFDPESYGVPRDHIQYDFENTPFQQYQEQGDDFPKESRVSYRDSRDKMKENYYSDFSISKPESMLDRYQNKLNYYKLFKQQKPEYFVVDENKQNQKSAKFLVAPTFGFQPTVGNAQSFYAQPKPQQQFYEYDYSQGAPRDNSGFASHPAQNFQRRTNFVEPQFQYGFEPSALPKLLDSELAAMASNDSPESEKPGMRKKLYKENWYIKQTSTSAGAPAS